jgi:hypothetical protein
LAAVAESASGDVIPAAAAGDESPQAPAALVPGVIALPAGPASPREIKLLIPEREFSAEGPGEALRVSFDDLDLLRVLNMEPVPVNAVDYFPSWLQQLNGQTIRLRGWMFPPREESGLPGFLFVRDNQICCFGREAKVYDKVVVNLKDGETTSYIQGRPFDVEGRFAIQPEELDGELFVVYYIEEATIIDG